MKILLTGAAGFIGRVVHRKLLEHGHEVRGVDYYSAQVHGDKPQDIPGVWRSSVSNAAGEWAKDPHERYDAVVHLAAEVGVGQSQYEPYRYVHANVDETAALWEAILRHKGEVRKVVVASCHDDRTRALTRSGLKTYAELSTHDEVLTLSASGVTEWQRVRSVVRSSYSGPMFHFKSNRTDCMVTPNHRVMFLDRGRPTRKIRYERAEHMAKRAVWEVPRANSLIADGANTQFVFQGEPSHWNAANKMRSMGSREVFFLLGIYTADGSASRSIKIRPGKTGLTARDFVRMPRGDAGRFQAAGHTVAGASVRQQGRSIRISAPEGRKKRTRLLEVLGTTGLKIWKNKHVVGFSHFGLWNLMRQCGTSAPEKHIPEFVKNASLFDQQAFLDGLMTGDGHVRRGGRCRVLSTTSERLALDVIEIATALGYASTTLARQPGRCITFPDGHLANGRRSFQVSVSATPRSVMRKNCHRVNYSGEVWCLSVPNGNFLIERNGKFTLSGNSMSIYGEGSYRDTETGTALNGGLRRRTDLGWSVFEDAYGRIHDQPTHEPTHESKTPEPASVYAQSKYDQECYSLILGKAHKVPTIALRFFNAIGPGQAISNPYTGVVVNFASRVINGRAPYVFEDGAQLRDFIHVDDVADAVIAATEADGVDGVFNVATGEGTSVYEIAETWCRWMFGRDGRYLTPDVTGQFRSGDIRHCIGDITAIRKALNWAPKRDIHGALADVAAWLESTGLADKCEDRSAAMLAELKREELVA